MFIRIVKMTFDSTKVDIFLENFNKNKEKIRNFEGCRLLELYRDKNTPIIFFSYSLSIYTPIYILNRSYKLRVDLEQNGNGLKDISCLSGLSNFN
mgnify:CR=1 FL=1